MPVVSKPVRSRNAPPIIGPRPYKNQRQAWSTNEPTAAGAEGSSQIPKPVASPVLPKASILRKPSDEPPSPSKQHPCVTFSNENDYKCVTPRYPLRKPRKPVIELLKESASGDKSGSNCVAADSKTTYHEFSLSRAVKECEVGNRNFKSCLLSNTSTLVFDCLFNQVLSSKVEIVTYVSTGYLLNIQLLNSSKMLLITILTFSYEKVPS